MVDAEIQTAPEVAPSASEDRRAEIIQYVRKISTIINELDAKSGRVSCELGDDNVVRSGLNYISTIKEAVDQFLRFLESPLGRTTTDLLWKYIDGIRNLAEVGAGIFLSSLFVVVAQELIVDVKEDEFDSARKRIEECIRFVQSKLPEIEERINGAAELLRLVRNHGKGAGSQSNGGELETMLWNFNDTIRLAKLDIDDCQVKLDETDEKIEIAMAKIKAKMWLNGAWRGALLGGGALAIYLSVKNRRLPIITGLAIGICLSCGTLFVRVPRYRKLEKDFLEYRDTHTNLHSELRRLQKRLDSHDLASRLS